MTGYINLSDFLLDRLKSLLNTRISLDLFEDSILKSDLCSQEEFNKSMKFLLDSDKIEYKVDKYGIRVEVENRSHSPWVNIPVGRMECPDSYNPGDTDPCIVPSENLIPYAISDSGGWSTVSNFRWYTNGSISTNWDLTDGQLIVGSDPRYKFILNVPTMIIEVPENSERIPIKSFQYTRTNDTPREFYSTTFERQYYQEPIDIQGATISGSFKIILPLDNTDSIGFLINQTEGYVNLKRFLIKFESEQYDCLIDSVEFNYNTNGRYNNEYTFRFSGSRIQ